jgi:hypothetical protein
VLVRALAVVLALVGAFVNFLSVRLYYGEWLGATANPYWRALFRIQGPNTSPGRATQVDFHFSASPIWGDVILIRHHIADVAGMWWVIGHGPVGWALLAVGTLILVAAAVGTRRIPASRSNSETEPTTASVPAGKPDGVSVADHSPDPVPSG